MEEEAPSRRSVAELAGRFKGSAPPHDAAGPETEKPVRRRPPRSLQLPKTHGDNQEQSPGVTSPVPAAKRNSALIEKLQASLVLPSAAPLLSPKSPGFRLLPHTFPPSSPGSSPATPVISSSAATPTSPVTEEEGPASFEAPPTVEEGSILSNANIKGRARHSIRRRPPSRRHRKSSSGDEVGVADSEGDVSLSSPSEPEVKTPGGGEKEEAGELFKQEGQTDEVKEDKTDASTCPEKNESHEEDRSEISAEPGEEDEKKEEAEEGSKGGEEGEGSSSGRKEEEEEKNSEEKKEEDLTEGATNTDCKEEEKTQEASQCSVR
ncbi:duboraya [Chelmon rostratus]|uniref:duboraya n=1 Tax=Chelmon rostratus TaxID=109905 RepID=UPI001BEA3A46|nr:duboraya [Chelmon rostratus]